MYDSNRDAKIKHTDPLIHSIRKTLAPPSFHENLTLQNMIESSHTPKYMIPH